jgi:uncharacterized membrane protein
VIIVVIIIVVIVMMSMRTGQQKTSTGDIRQAKVTYSEGRTVNETDNVDTGNSTRGSGTSRCLERTQTTSRIKRRT